MYVHHVCALHIIEGTNLVTVVELLHAVPLFLRSRVLGSFTAQGLPNKVTFARLSCS